MKIPFHVHMREFINKSANRTVSCTPHCDVIFNSLNCSDVLSIAFPHRFYNVSFFRSTTNEGIIVFQRIWVTRLYNNYHSTSGG